VSDASERVSRLPGGHPGVLVGVREEQEVSVDGAENHSVRGGHEDSRAPVDDGIGGERHRHSGEDNGKAVGRHDDGSRQESGHVGANRHATAEVVCCVVSARNYSRNGGEDIKYDRKHRPPNSEKWKCT
jgi:hypothetical protein